MDYPFFDPEFEVEVNPDEPGLDENWAKDYRFYHRMKGRWTEIVNTYQVASNEWWEAYRIYHEEKRFHALGLGAAKIDTLRSYAKKYAPPAFVETGTYMGETTLALMDDFEVLYTIEIEDDLYIRALDLFVGTKVVPLHGSSSDLLPVVAKMLDSRPALFWIDAHYCGAGSAPADRGSPAQAELEFLFTLPPQHVILIDDARYFGGVSERDAMAEGYPTQDWVREAAESAGYSFSVAQDIIRLVPAS